MFANSVGDVGANDRGDFPVCKGSQHSARPIKRAPNAVAAAQLDKLDLLVLVENITQRPAGSDGHPPLSEN